MSCSKDGKSYKDRSLPSGYCKLWCYNHQGFWMFYDLFLLPSSQTRASGALVSSTSAATGMCQVIGLPTQWLSTFGSILGDAGPTYHHMASSVSKVTTTAAFCIASFKRGSCLVQPLLAVTAQTSMGLWWQNDLSKHIHWMGLSENVGLIFPIIAI